MSVQPSNQATALPKTMKSHHWRHIISGTVVFFLGVLVNEGIHHMRFTWPHKVVWPGARVQEGFRLSYTPIPIPGSNDVVEIGFVDNGAVIWRRRDRQ